MFCPFCNIYETKVVDSRLVLEGSQVRRRRECLNCAERFTTYEKPDLVLPQVVKNDQSRVSFDMDKLRAGFSKALEKRPVSVEQIEQAVMVIVKQIQGRSDREISSRQLGEWVMASLRQLDEVAYVRFASVYRRFEGVNDFQDEVDRLKHP